MFGVALVLANLAPEVPPLIPLPQSQKVLGTTPFAVKTDTKINSEQPLFAVQELRTIFPSAPLADSPVRAANQINFRREPTFQAEQYVLNVAPTRIDIAYGDASGALYAVETLRQLANQNQVLSYRIEDKPRFSWRGWHLDVSRHFFTVAEVKRSLDQMTRYKLNRFHWHLVDDGGWRIALDRYPELTKKGAYRKSEPWSYSKIELTTDTKGYGGFYTKQEVREVVAYAKERGITVVPEIEMPGHTLPSIHAFPSLGCRDAKRIPDNSWVTNVYCEERSSRSSSLKMCFPKSWNSSLLLGSTLAETRWIRNGGGSARTARSGSRPRS